MRTLVGGALVFVRCEWRLGARAALLLVLLVLGALMITSVYRF